MFKLCILEAGYINPALKDKYPPYSDLFKDFLKYKTRNWNVSSYRLYESEFPHSINDFDGFIITGSSFGVYENFSWIVKTIRLINQIISKKKQLVGICFGHQLVAQALGGTVGKSDKGWGVGVNCYNVDQAAFDLADGDQFCLLASHQDQVMAMPPGAQQIATNDHCEVAGMTLGEHILTFQGHPEFIPEYSREIMNFRHDMIGAERVAEGMASFEWRQHEGDRVARWMLAFLNR